jgi:hypothetical protein
MYAGLGGMPAGLGAGVYSDKYFMVVSPGLKRRCIFERGRNSRLYLWVEQEAVESTGVALYLAEFSYAKIRSRKPP